MIFDDEKFKELMYDLQRSLTDEDSHELILKYSEQKGKIPLCDNIICIKDVIMTTTGDKEFTKGRTYRLRKLVHAKKFDTVNDSGIYHGVGMDKDGFFHEHFDFI